MATNTYGLPDATLQLIASSPDFDFGLPQQGTAAQFATPDVRRSDLISALRNIPGASNPGFTQYANPANGAALQPVSHSYGGANNPGRLSIPKYVAPEVTFPGGGDTGTGVINPFVPDVFDFPVVPDVIEPDVVEPEVVEPEVVEPDVVEPEVIEPEVTEPEVIEPVVIEPDDFEPFVPLPIEEPEVPEKTGTVEITPVDPDEEAPQDDGTTEGIIDAINEGFPTPEVEEDTPVETVPVETVPVEQPVEEVPMDDGTTDAIQEVIDSLPVDLAPEPEVVAPEIIEPEPQPEPVEPEPEPTLRDEIENAIESQPQPEPEPEPEVLATEWPEQPGPEIFEQDSFVPEPAFVGPMNDPSLRDEIISAIETQPQPEPEPEPELEPVIPEPESYVPDAEPYVPEPEPYVPDALDEAAFIDSWLADQFGDDISSGGGGVEITFPEEVGDAGGDFGGSNDFDFDFGSDFGESFGGYGYSNPYYNGYTYDTSSIDNGGRSFGGGGKGVDDIFDDIFYLSDF